MKTIKTFKANPIGSEAIEPLKIEFTKDIPEFSFSSDYEEKYKEIYNSDAKKIVDALGFSLPGGLIDAILVELLKQKTCILSVPFVSKPTNN